MSVSPFSEISPERTCMVYLSILFLIFLKKRVLFYTWGILLYGGGLQRGGDNGKSDWSRDHLKQRMWPLEHTFKKKPRRNVLHWLVVSCDHRCVDRCAKPRTTVSLTLFHSSIGDTHTEMKPRRQWSHRNPPFFLSDQWWYFLLERCQWSAAWWADLCRLISGCSL